MIDTILVCLFEVILETFPRNRYVWSRPPNPCDKRLSPTRLAIANFDYRTGLPRLESRDKLLVLAVPVPVESLVETHIHIEALDEFRLA
jgi:hypothetical protein